MKENYFNYYIKLDGNISERKALDKTLMILFAGSKFMFDRIASTLGLLLLSPLMIIISILIKLDSKGPVLFKQERTGKNGKKIIIYKFRTMVESNDVHNFSIPDNVTRFGKLLRKTSLDEIPQLISVAIGDMSLIGPRPWITDYYDNMNDIQRCRNVVRPGLTGLAQVMGRNNLSITEKIKYDLEYIEDYSLTQDIKIMFLTIKTLFNEKGRDAGKELIKIELEELKRINNTKKS